MTVFDLMTHPHEAAMALEAIQAALDAQASVYCQYDIGGLQFLSVIFPDRRVGGTLAMVYECELSGRGSRGRAIKALEKICNKHWHGPGCTWQNYLNLNASV